MVLTYICTKKCFFNNRLYEVGDKAIFEEGLGDAHPFFEREGKANEEQIAMQSHKSKKTNSEAEIPVPKAGVKASSSAKKGDKTK